MNFAFNSRNTYVEYRTTWKARYEQQAARQRQLKHDIARIFKEGGSPGHQQWNLVVGANECRHLLEELKEAKAEAGKQYAQEKQNLASS